jgi:hypothetical protein
MPLRAASALAPGCRRPKILPDYRMIAGIGCSLDTINPQVRRVDFELIFISSVRSIFDVFRV